MHAAIYAKWGRKRSITLVSPLFRSRQPRGFDERGEGGQGLCYLDEGVLRSMVRLGNQNDKP